MRRFPLRRILNWDVTQNHILLKQDIEEHYLNTLFLQYDTDGESELLHMAAQFLGLCLWEGNTHTALIYAVSPQKVTHREEDFPFFSLLELKKVAFYHCISELLSLYVTLISATLLSHRSQINASRGQAVKEIPGELSWWASKQRRHTHWKVFTVEWFWNTA